MKTKNTKTQVKKNNIKKNNQNKINKTKTIADKISFFKQEDGFLGISEKYEKGDIDNAKVVVVPFGLEKSVSYGGGTKNGPTAIIKASHQVELFDEEFWCEPCKEYGVITAKPTKIDKTSIEKALKQLEEQDWLGTILSTIEEQGMKEAARYVLEKGQGVRSITSRGKKGAMFDYFPTPPAEPKIKGTTKPQDSQVPKPTKAAEPYQDPQYADLATWWVMNNVWQMPTGKFNNLYDSIMLYLSPDFSKKKAINYVLGRFDSSATSSKDYFTEGRRLRIKLIV